MGAERGPKEQGSGYLYKPLSLNDLRIIYGPFGADLVLVDDPVQGRAIAEAAVEGLGLPGWDRPQLKTARPL